MIKTLLVDEHASMLDGLTTAFEATGDFAVVGRMTNAERAVAGCAKLAPDLALLDMRSDSESAGLKAAATLRQKYPALKIIVFTAFDDISYIPRAKAAGADGFVYKTSGLKDFVAVARRVMAGEKCFPAPKDVPLPHGKSPLTSRELEILRLLCQHKRPAEIAEQLYISADTVKYHKKTMLARTGFARMNDLIFYMINNGYINPLN